MLNIVTHAPGEAGPIGDELVENPHVRRLDFTGSTETGRKLAEAAGRNLKRIVLELGGYNPLIVLADGDLEYAVDASAFGAFSARARSACRRGRSSSSGAIADAFVERLAAKTRGLKAGDPKKHDTIIGPLINGSASAGLGTGSADAVARAQGCSPAARPRGLLPGDAARRRPGKAEFGRLEASGPSRRSRSSTAPTRRWRRANATRYGLASGILTSDTERGLALAQKVEAGIVHVNDQPVGDEPQMPFGGVKDSGFGRSAARRSVDEFTEFRWVTVQSGSHPFPF